MPLFWSTIRIEHAMKKDPAILHKYVTSLLSRRAPEMALVPDENAWFSIDSVLRALHEDPLFRWVRESTLLQLPVLIKSSQLEVEEKRIRPKGISHIQFPQKTDSVPDLLFAACKPKNVFHIYNEGLCDKNNFLILSLHTEKALEIARRLVPDPVLLHVQPKKSPESVFYTYGEFYLTNQIAAMAIEGPPLEKIQQPKKTISTEEKDTSTFPAMAGSFILDDEKITDKHKMRYAQKKGQKKEIDWKKDRRKARSTP